MADPRGHVPPGPARPRATLVKLGGELLERDDLLGELAAMLVRLGAHGPLVTVHGGGKEIDRELERRGIVKRTVDGIRVTDAATLSVVVSVLAGLVNTRLVAAMVAAGGRAVGLTGADASTMTVEPAPPHRTTDGRLVDLELVGQPVAQGSSQLLLDLCDRGFLPVVASIGASTDGRLFNVNADTAAAHLAASIGASRMLIAGSTPGVLDSAGIAIERLGSDTIRARIESGEAHGGMAAKLTACLAALDAGVEEVVVLDGRMPSNLHPPQGTRIERSSGDSAMTAMKPEKS